MAFECSFQLFSYKSFANIPPKGGGGGGGQAPLPIGSSIRITPQVYYISILDTVKPLKTDTQIRVDGHLGKTDTKFWSLTVIHSFTVFKSL